MTALSWQAVIVMLSLVGATTFLVWHGSVPSHAFTLLLGGFIGSMSSGVAMSVRSAVEARRISRASGRFTPDEIPTDKGRKAIVDISDKRD